MANTDLFTASVKIKAVVDQKQAAQAVKQGIEDASKAAPPLTVKPKINPKDTKDAAKKGIEDPLKETAKNVTSILATIGVASLAKSSLDYLKQEQTALLVSDSLVKQYGASAGVTSDELTNLAQSAQDVAAADKNVYLAGTNVLLQFSSIKNAAGAGNDVFDRTAKLLPGLAILMGTDTAGAANTLGKALSSPENGARALLAAHVRLQPEQRAFIKNLQDSGDLLGAQKYLLDIVTDHVGDLGAAYGDSTAGKIDRSTESLKQAGAAIVGSFTPAINAATAAGNGISNVLENLPGPLQAAVGGTVALAVAARPLSLLFSGLRQIMSVVADGIRAVVSRVASLDGSLGKLGAQAGIASAGLIAVTLYAKAYSDALDDARRATDDLTKAAQAKTFGGGFEDAKNQLKAVDDQVTGLDKDINDLHFYDVTKQNDLQTLKNGLADTHNQLTVLLQEAVDLSAATGKSKDETFKWLAEQAKAGTTFQSSADALKAFTGAVDDTASAADDAAAASKRFDDALQGQKQRLQELTDQYHTAIDARTELVTGRLDINQADRDIRTAQRNLADALKDPNRTADTVAQAQDDLARAVVRRADVEVEQANRVREAQTGQAIDATEKANIYNQSIDDQAIKIGNVGTQVDNLKIKLDDLASEDFVVKLRAEETGAAWNVVKKAFGFGQGGDSTSTQDPNRDPVTGGRATGGPVNAGTVYRVGENGPETFTSGGRNYILPGENGQITPGGGGMTNVFNISNPDPMSVAREISYSLLQAAPGLHARQAA